MLLVARVAEFDAVGGYSLPHKGLVGEGWRAGDNVVQTGYMGNSLDRLHR